MSESIQSISKKQRRDEINIKLENETIQSSDAEIKKKKTKKSKQLHSPSTIKRLNAGAIVLRESGAIGSTIKSAPATPVKSSASLSNDTTPVKSSTSVINDAQDTPTPLRGGLTREIAGLGEYLLIQKGTYTNTVSTAKPNLRVGKIVAYNCLREKGEIIVFSDTNANNNSADVMEKHLESVFKLTDLFYDDYGSASVSEDRQWMLVKLPGKPAGLNGHYQIKPGNSQYGSVFVASYSMPKNSNLRAPPQFMLPVPAHLSPSEVLTHGKVDSWIPQVLNQVFDFDDANQKSTALMSLLLARSSSSGRT